MNNIMDEGVYSVLSTFRSPDRVQGEGKRQVYVGKYQVDVASFEETALPSLELTQRDKHQKTQTEGGQLSTAALTPNIGRIHTPQEAAGPDGPSHHSSASPPSPELLSGDWDSSKPPGAVSQSAGRGKKKGLVVIDEIGKMELFSRNFVESVKALFQRRDVVVLATIPVARQKSHWLVDELRHRSDCLLFEVYIYNVLYIIVDELRHRSDCLLFEVYTVDELRHQSDCLLFEVYSR